MSLLKDASDLTAKSLSIHKKALLGLTAVRMLIMTALVFFIIMANSLSLMISLPAVLFLGVFASLLIDHKTLRLIYPRRRKIQFGSILLFAGLAVLSALPMPGIAKALDWINTEWDAIYVAIFSSVGGAVRCGALLLVVLLGLWIYYSLLSMLTREATVRLSERDQTDNWGQILGSVLRHFITPSRWFFCRLGWFVLRIVLTLALLIGACLLITPITLESGLSMAAVTVLVTLLSLPSWEVALCLSLGAVWVLGLGFISWPHCCMTRLIHSRLLMKKDKVL